MHESLFSDVWYRVADTRPQLRTEVAVQRQRSRCVNWYVLANATNGRHFRVNRKAYEFIGRCDGTRTVQRIWDELLERYGDEAPTQDEVVQTLNELEAKELLAHEGKVDAPALVRRRDERDKQQKNQRFVNPLALRVPLGDPSAWLARSERLARRLFNGYTLAAWLALTLAAIVAAAPHWNALSAHAALDLASPRHVLLAWVVFPLLKAVHEAAHGLAVRRWGGEVHDAGFTLFVLIPAPYVDASAAAGFAHRHQRLVVGAAGVMAELTIAAAALFAWINVEPGFVRDLAFVTLFIASVSTVMFNGNPLLRFDAYYVLCDVLDLPNLATRSQAWWRAFIVRALGGTTAAHAPPHAAGELKWLVAYAPLSLAAQVTVSCVLVLWVGAQSALLAAAAAAVVGWLLLVRPVANAAKTAWAAAAPVGGRLRAGSIAGGGLALVLLALLAIPLPFHTIAGGVVWPPEQARVRPGTDGFVAEIRARDGDRVAAGQVLVLLEDPALHAERARLLNRLEQLHANRYGSLAQSPEQAGRAEEEIGRVEAEVQRIEQRIGHLEVRAQTEGTLAMPFQRDLPGTFVKQGTTIAHVLAKSDIAIRAAVPEYDAALVREDTRAVAIRLAGTGTHLDAELVRHVPAATYELPSPALGDRGGGALATDPQDKEGVRTRQPVVLVDVKVPTQRLERIGATAWVRFDHGAQPLAQRWYRQLRQVLLQHLNPAG